MIRLAGAVLPPADQEVHLPSAGSSGITFPGAPVVVGPRGAGAAEVGEALAALERLVRAGGIQAAGAGVDLGGGFRSARLDGGRGDRRDAYLAALRTDESRLGPPAEILVALFGPAATKRVGAAARAAIAAGQWSALRFAAAASDVAGPEQLEQLLALRAPDDIDTTAAHAVYGEGLASDTAAHLTRLLAPVARPRRVAVLTDLWNRVVTTRVTAARAAGLRASQDTGRFGEIRDRYRDFDDHCVLQVARMRFGRDLRPAELATWIPTATLYRSRAAYLFPDALAATVLCRMAETAYDTDTATALDRHLHELVAVDALLSDQERDRAAAYGHQAHRKGERTITSVARIVHLRNAVDVAGPRLLATVDLILHTARDRGEAVLSVLRSFLPDAVEVESAAPRRVLDEFLHRSLTPWRESVGYFSPGRIDGSPLADRLAASSGAETAAALERVGDMLWLIELADRVARLHGHPAAEVEPTGALPYLDVDPAPEIEPLVPRTESITTAVAAAAQLVELGGAVPPKSRDWSAVVAGLLADAAVAEALTGAYDVPEPIAATDGATVPGAGLRVEVARTGRQLAEWGGYMGNCIGGGYYLDAAERQEAVLLALRDPPGKIVLNAELTRGRRHWHLAELKARFNAEPDPDHHRHVAAWVRTLPVPRPPQAVGELAPAVRPDRARRSPTPAARALRAAGPALIAEISARPIVPAPLLDLAALLPRPPRARGPEAIVALRRARPDTLTALCRTYLSTPDRLDTLWRATGERPLADAIERVAAAGGEAAEVRLDPLARDASRPGYLRPLSRVPEVLAARAVDLVAMRLRAALGRLLRDDDPALTAALTRRPTLASLCATALAATALPGTVEVVPPGFDEVPGYPSTRLSADPWLSARPAAAELIAGAAEADGLRVPSSWLGTGGWPALWSRAAH